MHTVPMFLCEFACKRITMFLLAPACVVMSVSLRRRPDTEGRSRSRCHHHERSRHRGRPPVRQRLQRDEQFRQILTACDMFVPSGQEYAIQNVTVSAYVPGNSGVYYVVVSTTVGGVIGQADLEVAQTLRLVGRILCDSSVALYDRLRMADGRAGLRRVFGDEAALVSFVRTWTPELAHGPMARSTPITVRQQAEKQMAAPVAQARSKSPERREDLAESCPRRARL